MSEVLSEVIPGAKSRLGALSGPNLAVEVARGAPTASVVASAEPAAALAIQRLFSCRENPTFRVYTSGDVIGVELGGAIKNVIAIGAGVCDGQGFGWPNDPVANLDVVARFHLGAEIGAGLAVNPDPAFRDQLAPDSNCHRIVDPENVDRHAANRRQPSQPRSTPRKMLCQRSRRGWKSGTTVPFSMPAMFGPLLRLQKTQTDYA